MLIRPLGGGVCGTDVSIYHWYAPIAAEYRPVFPLIMGHENAGTVEAVGAGVEGLQPGALVAVNPHVNCGACFFCNAGRHSLCERRQVLGCHANGGWAEQMLVPARNAQPLPVETDPTVAPLAEPFAVAVHAVVERAALQPGETVLVQGAGTIGLLHLLVAQALGAGPVIVAGRAADAARLKLASELGAVTVDVEAQELPAAVRRIAPRGADVAFDTTGSAAALAPAVASVRKGGRVALVGINHDTAPLDTFPLVMDERDLLGCRAYGRNTWPQVATLLPRLNAALRRLVTHELPLEEAEAAIGLIERGECIKVVLRPHA